MEGMTFSSHLSSEQTSAASVDIVLCLLLLNVSLSHLLHVHHLPTS